MIAKLVASGADREGARRALARACGEVRCTPVRNNAWFLRRLVEQEQFAIGTVTTGFIAEHVEGLTTRSVPPDRALSELVGALALESTDYDDRTEGLLGFRLNSSRRSRQTVDLDGATVEFEFSPPRRA